MVSYIPFLHPYIAFYRFHISLPQYIVPFLFKALPTLIVLRASAIPQADSSCIGLPPLPPYLGKLVLNEHSLYSQYKENHWCVPPLRPGNATTYQNSRLRHWIPAINITVNLKSSYAVSIFTKLPLFSMALPSVKTYFWSLWVQIPSNPLPCILICLSTFSLKCLPTQIYLMT